MSRSRAIVACIVCVSAAAVVSAQQRSPTRHAPFGFTGRFGEIQANNPSLLAVPEVRAELRFDAAQGNQVDTVLNRLGKARPRVQLQDLSNLNPDERRKHIEKQNKAFAEAHSSAERELNDLLTEPQRTRLHQLLLQRQGAVALLRPDVSEPLGLTRGQREKIREIVKSVPAFPVSPRATAEERRGVYKRLQAANAKAMAAANGVLDNDQKSRFDKIKGKDFVFPSPSAEAPATKPPANP